MPWLDRDKKRAADRQRVARKRAALREQKRLTVRQWHRRQLGPDHDWHPGMSVSLEQWRHRSRLSLIAEREGRLAPVTTADLMEMAARAERGLAELRARRRPA